MDEKEVDLVVHLDEMRKRLIITVGCFLLVFLAAFMFAEDIYHWIVRDLPMKLTILGPSDIILVYFMIAGVLAIAGTIPIGAYQVWLFIRPALTVSERKVTLAYIPGLFSLFILGIAFGYFVIVPIVFQFLLSLSGELVHTSYTTEKYFRFLLQMTLPFGFLFELPVIILFLTSLGILNPYRLQRVRKYAYFILIVVSILVTPPDFFSDVLVIIPLLVLYECSVMLSKFVFLRKEKLKLAA